MPVALVAKVGSHRLTVNTMNDMTQFLYSCRPNIIETFLLFVYFVGVNQFVVEETGYWQMYSTNMLILCLG